MASAEHEVLHPPAGLPVRLDETAPPANAQPEVSDSGLRLEAALPAVTHEPLTAGAGHGGSPSSLDGPSGQFAEPATVARVQNPDLADPLHLAERFFGTAVARGNIEAHTEQRLVGYRFRVWSVIGIAERKSRSRQ